jgi:hypothetical protein
MRKKTPLGLIVASFAALLLPGLTGCTSILGDFKADGGAADAKEEGPDTSDAGHDGGGHDGGGHDGPTGPFTIGGDVTGLQGSGLVLLDNEGDALSISGNGPFKFATPLADGVTYDVSVSTQPTTPTQTCVAIKGKGKVRGADVKSVDIHCTTNLFTVSGMVSHLGAGNSVVLQDNGSDDLVVKANGAFSFKAKILDDGTYDVTVKTQPTASSGDCFVSLGSGTIASGDVTNVSVTCSGCGRFKTGFTGAWTTVENNPFGPGMFMSDILPSNAPASLYLFSGNNVTTGDTFINSSDSYFSLTASPIGFSAFASAAWYSSSLWVMQGSDVLQYDVGTATWSNPYTSLTSFPEAQTAVDSAGNLWGYETAGALNAYNIASGENVVHPLSTALPGDEPRIVYDACADLLYLSDYTATPFYSYDPVKGTQTTLSGLPSAQAFQDGFCGDGSGHIFAFVDATTMYQYTIATDTWVAMPTGPVGADNSACGVGADGNLYASEPGSGATMYQIPIK